MRLVDELVHLGLGFLIHAERTEVEAPGLLVEQTQHDAFAVSGWHRRYADVDGATGDLQRYAAVLR